MSIKLTGLTYEDYAHEKDCEAMNKLEKSPTVRSLMGSMSDFDYELRVKTPTMGNGLHLDGSLAPELCQLVEELCEILDYNQKPELYVKRIFSLDTEIIGYRTPVLIVPRLVMELKPAWLAFEIGGAIAKFKSGYLPYFHTASLINSGCEKLLPKAVSDAVMSDFRSWSRKAELSADRAGLLACQDFEESMKFLMLKAGMTADMLESVNVMDYVEIVNEEIDAMSRTAKLGRINKNYVSNIGLRNDRIIELFRWYQSGRYDDILEKYGD